jgi:hypothetical protein
VGIIGAERLWQAMAMQIHHRLAGLNLIQL